MVNTTKSKAPDTGSWVHGCFTVTVGTQFKTFKDVASYTLQDEIFGHNTKAALDVKVQKILSKINRGRGYLPNHFALRKCRDTSLGGNDSINPLPQFGIDDDISHPLYYATLDGSVGMGQVYSENYDDTQQILYLGFGIPLFTNLASFWGSATDLEMATYVNKGTGITAEKIGYLIGSAPIRIISVVTVPFKWIGSLFHDVGKVKITKYYSFQNMMPMYFRYVNTILVMLATNLEIMGSNYDINNTGSNSSGVTALQLDSSKTSQVGNNDLSGISDIFKNYGLDMAQIVTKRYMYEAAGRSPLSKIWTDPALLTASDLNASGSTDVTNASTPATSTNATPPSSGSTTDAIAAQVPSVFWKQSWIDAISTAYNTSIYDGHMFIGFRIDKGMSASESFSNATGETKIAQVANQKYQDGLDANMSSMGGDFGTGNNITGAISDAISGAKSLLTGITSAIGLDPLAAVMTGSAKIDIPEVWTGSGYSRSSSFSLTCLSPYGDMESIFQSEYVPLACILAGVLPRATGYSSHSSAFVCQAYCRGIFSSPLCIIESVEVTRGADQFGFSSARLPLELSINVTLKDLYPTMVMNMGGDKGIAKDLLGADDLFTEYMMTLGSTSLRDRLSSFIDFRRRAVELASIVYKNRLNPFLLGMDGGSRFKISRVYSFIKSAGSGLQGN